MKHKKIDICAGEKLYARAVAAGEDPRDDDCAELQRQDSPLRACHLGTSVIGLPLKQFFTLFSLSFPTLCQPCRKCVLGVA